MSGSTLPLHSRGWPAARPGLELDATNCPRAGPRQESGGRPESPRESRFWALGAALLLVVGACAGRAERTERAAQETAPQDQVGVAAPRDPSPLDCTADADCRLTQLPRPIATVVDCYCPECPRPLSDSAAAEHEQAWERLCAGDWETARRCLAPMCPPLPGILACLEGRCGFGVVP